MSVHPSTSSSPSAAELRRLAEALAATEPNEPLLVRLCCSNGRLEIGLVPIAEIDPLACHPSEFLLGFEAPAAWWGIGLVATGRIHSEAGAPRQHDPVPVVVCQLAARNGDVAHAVRSRNGEPGVEMTMTGAGRPRGRVPDLLQRSLGRPIVTDGRGPGHWIEQLWLDTLVADAARDPGRLSWPAAAAKHPAGAALRAAGRGRVLDPATLQAATREHDRAGWRKLVSASPAVVAARLGFPDPDCTGWQLLEWVGADVIGMWLLAELPAASDLATALDDLVAPALARQVRSALTATS